jgi:histidyl-tRNA synthetase
MQTIRATEKLNEEEQLEKLEELLNLIKAEEYLEKVFKIGNCDGCGLEKYDHTVFSLFGNWFAKCLKPKRS